MSSRGIGTRFVLLILLVFALPSSLAACGSDDSSDTQVLAYTSTTVGGETKLSGPTTATSGVTEISLNNETEKEGNFQLIGVESGRSAEEAIDAISASFSGEPLPDWITYEGGVGRTAAGETATVTQVLEPGNYYAIDTGGEPNPDLAAALEVTGDDSEASLDAPDATVDAYDYNFSTDGLKAGVNEVLFENTGAEAHHVVYAPILGDATLDEIKTFLKDEKGPPPVDDKAAKFTAVLNGGQDQLTTLDFAESGRYVLVCFVSDREGGPPHVAKGMVQEVEVK